MVLTVQGYTRFVLARGTKDGCHDWRDDSTDGFDGSRDLPGARIWGCAVADL